MRLRHLLGICFLLIVLVSCNPETEVYAPERELYVVYGVLNPLNDVQYVTVTKIFQVEGDANVYADETDLTARNMIVTMQVDSTVLSSTLIDIFDSGPNQFSRTTGAYRFETSGADRILPGKRYDLQIRKNDDPDFLITAYTDVPTAPVLTSPGPPIHSVTQGVYTLPTMEFGEEQTVFFYKGTGKGFEVRVFVRYYDGQEYHIARWGPSPVFKGPRRCLVNELRGENCYIVPQNSVPRTLKAIFATYPDTVEVFDTMKVASTVAGLNRNVWVEVTGIDSFMTSYLMANSSFGFGLNLLIDKQEYSNISQPNIGVFGSIYPVHNYVFIGSCTRWIAGLRGLRPPGCDE